MWRKKTDREAALRQVPFHAEMLANMLGIMDTQVPVTARNDFLLAVESPELMKEHVRPQFLPALKALHERRDEISAVMKTLDAVAQTGLKISAGTYFDPAASLSIRERAYQTTMATLAKQIKEAGQLFGELAQLVPVAVQTDKEMNIRHYVSQLSCDLGNAADDIEHARGHGGV